MRMILIRNWWQASLLWGVAMLALNLFQNIVKGEVTFARFGKEAMIWAAAGLAFGLLLTSVLSLISQKNLFRSGFPEKGGSR